MGLLDHGSRLIGRATKAGSRPPLEGAYAYLLALLVGYAIADLAVLKVRPAMIPKKPPATKPQLDAFNQARTSANYQSIVDRNLFNSKGEDPPPLSQEEGEGKDQTLAEQEAVQSQLPLSLEGTIVHADPKKSVATIVAKSSNESKPFRVDEEIENLARVTKITRRRVEFINLNMNRLEFIEIPRDEKITFDFKAPKGEEDKEIVKRGEFDFQLKRDDIKKYLSDLSGILSQARMTPNVPPGGGGRVEGFRFVAIQPGSIYEKLGFKTQDIIKSVNGEPVNSPTKAMELYNALKDQGNIELEVERNGRTEKFNYNVVE